MNMSTIGTTFSSLFVALRPLDILPPRIFDFSNLRRGALAGRDDGHGGS